MHGSRERFLLTTWLIYGICYAVYGIGAVLFVIAIVPVSLLLKPFGAGRRTALMACTRFYASRLTQVLVPGLGIYKITEITGLDAACMDRPAVYVANHWGRLDAVLLLGILTNAVAVIKSKYARSFFYSSLVKHLGFVSVGSRSMDDLKAALLNCRELVRSGSKLIVFPEGTRSASRKLLPFSDLAFRVAIDMEVDVVPVIVYSDLPFMARVPGSYFQRKRVTFSIHFLPPVTKLPEESHTQLSDRIRKQMRAKIEALTVPEVVP